MRANFKAMEQRTPAVVSPAERMAINDVLAAGEKHGYGNMISWLQTAWAKKLVTQHKMSEKDARAGTGGTGYPLDWVQL